jgi:hypothetical protein
MPPSTDCAFSPNSVCVRSEEHDLQALQMRVSAEFREMPGLTLSRQALSATALRARGDPPARR